MTLVATWDRLRKIKLFIIGWFLAMFNNMEKKILIRFYTYNKMVF